MGSLSPTLNQCAEVYMNDDELLLWLRSNTRENFMPSSKLFVYVIANFGNQAALEAALNRLQARGSIEWNDRGVTIKS